MKLKDVLTIFRKESFSERDKGDRFERLIQALRGVLHRKK